MSEQIGNVSRRGLIMTTAAASLSGCSFVGKSPFLSTIAQAGKSASPAITREKVDAIPYASLVAWFDGNAKSLLVLGKYEPEQRLIWYSAEKQALTTWGPFVLTLVGADVDLLSTSTSGAWNTDPRLLVGQRLTKMLRYQASNGSANVTATSRFSNEGVEMVKLLDERRSLMHVQEHVRADGWHRFTNDYWIDPVTGFCWRSRQLVIPTMTKLNIIVARPPKGA